MASISLCATVKDEAGAVDELISDLKNQTRLPDEVVVVDGGSTDGTGRRLAAGLDGWTAFKLIHYPGSNIAQGRNHAVAASSGDIVALLDAGLRLRPDWLESLAGPLESQPAVDVVFGYVLSRPTGFFEAVLGAVTIPDEPEIDPDEYPPSAGSLAFRREFVEECIFPEWLDFGEDMYLDLKWRAQGRRLLHASGADVGFRPRRDLRAFFRQYFNYAKGDGKAGMWWSRHLIRYCSYAVGAWLGFLAPGRPFALLLLAVAGIAYLRRPYLRLARLIPRMSPQGALAAVALVPAIRAVGDIAKMLGFLVGLNEAGRTGRPSR